MDLVEMTSCVIDEGGEGTVLRLLGSPYCHGVSLDLLKFKVLSSAISFLLFISFFNFYISFFTF